jgi:cytochrome c oxidase subunit 4
MAEHSAHAHGDLVHEEAHASNRTYVLVAIILAIITIVEVAIWYIPSVRGILVPALLILSLAKFLAVVGFFMHLKYDHRLFRFMFFAGLLVTLGVYLAMLAMFWTTIYWAPLAPAAPALPGH